MRKLVVQTPVQDTNNLLPKTGRPSHISGPQRARKPDAKKQKPAATLGARSGVPCGQDVKIGRTRTFLRPSFGYGKYNLRGLGAQWASHSMHFMLTLPSARQRWIACPAHSLHTAGVEHTPMRPTPKRSGHSIRDQHELGRAGLRPAKKDRTGQQGTPRSFPSGLGTMGP